MFGHGGDPVNFALGFCETQRNNALSYTSRKPQVGPRRQRRTCESATKRRRAMASYDVMTWRRCEQEKTAS
eukprot:3998301-Pyramimonas_sp.AAC.1